MVVSSYIFQYDRQSAQILTTEINCILGNNRFTGIRHGGGWHYADGAGKI